jgi:uncharacterized protein (TIGR03382 family)
MNRAVFLARLTAIVVLLGHSGGELLAQAIDPFGLPPYSEYHYRFIPSRSSLEVTGGFAGIEQKFFPYGEFDLVTFNDSVTCAAIGCPPPRLNPVARFELERWDSWLVPDSPLAYVWSTDDTLNLSGLRGTFNPDDPSRMFFRGVDGQGQPFRLMAVQRGRLLHLVGENDPGCCDFFHYKFDAYAHLAPYSDFNLDGNVDRADLDTLMSNLGTFSKASLEQGDADADGDVDGDDFLTWQREVGFATPLSAFAGDSLSEAGFTTAAVPEPAAVFLALAGALFVWLQRRK